MINILDNIFNIYIITKMIKIIVPTNYFKPYSKSFCTWYAILLLFILNFI